MIKGVLFDMDGVLADSEKFICNAAIIMFSELGHTVSPSEFIPFVGTGENSYLGGVARSLGIKIDIEKSKARTYQIYSEITKGKLHPLPGAISFLESCLERKLLTALATSADAIKMEVTLREIGIPKSKFSAIITGLDVVNKKPAPDIYILASKLIGLNPAECLVIEDAVSGIKAGKAAGCRTLALTNSFSPDILHEADWICNSLENVPEQALNW